MHIHDKTAVFDFNPRLREGGDARYTMQGYGFNDFNPRLREGGDAAIHTDADGEPISIHASAREATTVSSKYGCYRSISIHASAREATIA